MKNLILLFILLLNTSVYADTCTKKYFNKAQKVELRTDLAKMGVAMAIVLPATVGALMLGPVSGVIGGAAVGWMYYGGLAAGGSVFLFNPTNRYAKMIKVIQASEENNIDEKYTNKIAKKITKCSNLTQEEAATLVLETIRAKTADGTLCNGKKLLTPRKLKKELKKEWCQ